MDEVTACIISLFLLIALFVSGLELAFAMAIVAVAGYAYIISPSAAMNMLANDVFDSLESVRVDGCPSFCAHGSNRVSRGDSQEII